MKTTLNPSRVQAAYNTATQTTVYMARRAITNGWYYTPVGLLKPTLGDCLVTHGMMARSPQYPFILYYQTERMYMLYQVQDYKTHTVHFGNKFSTVEDRIFALASKNTNYRRLDASEYTHERMTPQLQEKIAQIKPTAEELAMVEYIDQYVDINPMPSFCPEVFFKKQGKKDRDYDNSTMVESVL